MGIDTRAEAEPEGASALAEDGGTSVRELTAREAGCCVCELARACVPFARGGGWVSDEGDEDEDEEARVTDGSRRMTMLLTCRSVFGGGWSACFALPFPRRWDSSSSTSTSSRVNQPSPRVYGLASGEPLTLSMFSSCRGARRVGYVGAFGGSIVGLKVALEGGRVRWVVPFCLAGDVARAGTAKGGLLGLWGLGEGFTTGRRAVVVRSMPGVRLAASERAPMVFFGVAAITRAEYTVNVWPTRCG